MLSSTAIPTVFESGPTTANAFKKRSYAKVCFFADSRFLPKLLITAVYVIFKQ